MIYCVLNNIAFKIFLKGHIYGVNDGLFLLLANGYILCFYSKLLLITHMVFGNLSINKQ